MLWRPPFLLVVIVAVIIVIVVFFFFFFFYFFVIVFSSTQPPDCPRLLVDCGVSAVLNVGVSGLSPLLCHGLVFILAGALFYGTVSFQKILVSKYTVPKVISILTT